MKRNSEDWGVAESAQLGVGSYGGFDDRVKRRGRKHPIGFAPPKTPKSQPKKKKKR